MRITILTFLCLISFVSAAQFNKGARIIDADFSYVSNKSETLAILGGTLSTFSFENKALNISPSVGFAVQQNQLIYVGLDFQFEERTSQSTFSTPFKSTIYSVELGYERLFELNEKLYLAPTLSGTVGFGSREGLSVTEEVDIDLLAYGIELSPKLYYFIDSKWALSGSVGFIEYSRREEKVKPTGEEEFKLVTNTFQTILGLNSWTLGVSFILNNGSE